MTDYWPLLIALPLIVWMFVWSVRDSRRIAQLHRKADASGHALDAWIASTRPCPTCGGAGRVGEEG